MPKILLIVEAENTSINEIMEWLCYLKAEVLRINKEDAILDFKLDDNDIYFYIKEKWWKLSEFHSVLYWRGSLFYNFLNSQNIMDKSTLLQINNFLNDEWRIIVEYFMKKCEQKCHIGNYFSPNVNKLTYIDLAKKCGFLTPETLITTNTKDILDNFGNSPIITKSISELPTISVDNQDFSSLTSLITSDDLKIRKELFFPSLIQEAIEKQFEIHIFFLYEKIYSVALFSQNDSHTKIDYRNYQKKRMRVVPYVLPNLYKKKLKKLINLSMLNTGTIDMILSKDFKTYFLEINPFGNYTRISQDANFPIERDIAYFLLKKY